MDAIDRNGLDRTEDLQKDAPISEATALRWLGDALYAATEHSVQWSHDWDQQGPEQAVITLANGQRYSVKLTRMED